MDGKILVMIDTEVKKIPVKGNVHLRQKQYERSKADLCAKFPGSSQQYEYICKAIADKCKV